MSLNRVSIHTITMSMFMIMIMFSMACSTESTVPIVPRVSCSVDADCTTGGLPQCNLGFCQGRRCTATSDCEQQSEAPPNECVNVGGASLCIYASGCTQEEDCPKAAVCQLTALAAGGFLGIC